jgi:hypothetical protein
VDVLAEDGELLGQVAVALVDRVEAVARADAPIRPAVEGMRAAAADGDVVARALVDEDLAQPGEVGGDVVDGGRGCVLTSIMLSVISSLIVAEAAVVLEAG